jgi:hypothetical protein
MQMTSFEMKEQVDSYVMNSHVLLMDQLLIRLLLLLLAWPHALKCVLSYMDCFSCHRLIAGNPDAAAAAAGIVLVT